MYGTLNRLVADGLIVETTDRVRSGTRASGAVTTSCTERGPVGGAGRARLG